MYIWKQCRTISLHYSVLLYIPTLQATTHWDTLEATLSSKGPSFLGSLTHLPAFAFLPAMACAILPIASTASLEACHCDSACVTHDSTKSHLQALVRLQHLLSSRNEPNFKFIQDYKRTRRNTNTNKTTIKTSTWLQHPSPARPRLADHEHLLLHCSHASGTGYPIYRQVRIGLTSKSKQRVRLNQDLVQDIWISTLLVRFFPCLITVPISLCL